MPRMVHSTLEVLLYVVLAWLAFDLLLLLWLGVIYHLARFKEAAQMSMFRGSASK